MRRLQKVCCDFDRVARFAFQDFKTENNCEDHSSVLL